MANHGKNELLLASGGKLKTDRNGLVSGRCLFTVPVERWDLMPKLGAAHPYARFCEMENREVTFKRGLWQVSADYAGVEGAGDSEPQYGLRRATQREPIETHEDFVEKLGGSAGTPKNGAVFLDATGWPTSDDEMGVFDRFKITLDGGDKNPFAGVEAYLAPTNTVWSAKWTSKAKPSPGTGVGKVDANPEGGPPDYGDNYRWLYTGMSYEKRGGAYSVSKEWLLGRWLELLYGNS